MTTGRRLTPAELDKLRELYETCHWMTVAEIAALAGIGPGSVNRRARRHGWRRAAPMSALAAMIAGAAQQPPDEPRPALPRARPPAAGPDGALSADDGPGPDGAPAPGGVPGGRPAPDDPRGRAPDPGTAPATAPATDPATDRGALIAGLWRAVQVHVAELSGGVCGAGEADPAGGARSAQTLMTIARTVEKLIEMERADAAAAADAAVSGLAGGAGGAAAALRADEFRDEIARRLEGLLGARTGGGGQPPAVA